MTETAASAERNIREVAKLLKRINETKTDVLVDLLDINRSGWFDRCNGRTRFSTAELAMLAEFYAVPVQVFFDGPNSLLAVTPQQRNRRATDRAVVSQSHPERRSQDGGSLTWRRWSDSKRLLPSGPVCRRQAA